MSIIEQARSKAKAEKTSALMADIEEQRRVRKLMCQIARIMRRLGFTDARVDWHGSPHKRLSQMDVVSRTLGGLLIVRVFSPTNIQILAPVETRSTLRWAMRFDDATWLPVTSDLRSLPNRLQEIAEVHFSTI